MRVVVISLFVVFGVAAGFGQRFGATQSANQTIFIDADGFAYGWGPNGHSALGVGDSFFVRTPAIVGFPDGVAQWLSATSGGRNGAFIANDSNLYFTGTGRLPEFFGTDTLKTPTLFPKPPGVTGWKSVSFWRDVAHIAVTTGERAYYWDKNHPDPTFIPLPQGVNKWEEAIAGEDYYLLLTDDGSLFGFGENGSGQLGNQTSEDKPEPTRVYNPIGVYKWKSMAAGSFYGYSLGIDENGKLYSWGTHLVTGPFESRYIDSTKFEPKAHSSTEVWEKIIINGGGTVLGLTQDRKIFIWGGDDSLELGLGDGRQFLKEPILIPYPEGVTAWIDISLTEYNGFALDQDCRVWGWGYNSDRDNSIGLPQDSGYVFRTPHLIRQFCQAQGVDESVELKLPELRVFPNPASEQMAVEIDLLEAARIKVVLTDLLGRERAVLFEGASDQGKQRLQFNSTAIEAGSYILSVTTPKVKRFVRVEILR